MRFFCHCAVLLTCAVLVNPSRADTADVLRLIPHQADLLVKIEQPRTLVEAVINHRIGKDFYAAVVGSALVISNLEKGLQAAIDQHLDGGKHSLAQVDSVADARRLANPDPLAWVWVNLDTVRKTGPAKELLSGNNPVA